MTPPLAPPPTQHNAPRERTHSGGRVEFAVWPTILFGLGLRTLVPGELLIHHAYWFLPAVAAAHILVHYLYAYRRNVTGVRFGTGKFVSHLAFLLFMVFQIETLNGQSHPVIVWGAYMLGWDLGSGLSFASDPVWNPINLFLVGMLAFSYYMMLMHAFEEPDEHEFEAIRFDERLLTKLVDTADAHWPADEFEEADEERAEADAQLHQSSIRVHTVY